VAFNGTPVRSLPGLVRLLQDNKEKPAKITVVRDGQQMSFTAAPVLTDVQGEKRYRLGFLSDPQTIEKLPFPEAFVRSLDSNKENSKLILVLFEKMVQRKVSMKQLYGPIGIAQASGEAARQPGWTPLLQLMAVISLNLGIINLFPIPIMDGGVILLLGIESIMRRDISMRIKERIYQAAFVFLILFAVMVIYNDLSRAIPGLGSRLP
jgi:regulator of sigma E protease